MDRVCTRARLDFEIKDIDYKKASLIETLKDSLSFNLQM
jgi:hypothetical protein